MTSPLLVRARQLSAAPVARRHALVLMVVTAVLFSTSGLFVKIISWGPLAILSGRSLVATAVLLAYLGRPDMRWTRAQWIGAFGYVGAQLFFVSGTKLTAAANVIFLQYTSPLYIIPLGYWLLRERPQRSDWVAMPVIFGGMMLFFADDLTVGGFQGNLFGMLSGLSMATMVLAMRWQKAGTPANTILLGNLLGFGIGLPWLVRASYSATSVGIILFLGIFQIGLSLVLYSIAIRSLQALESTLILTLEPVLNPIWVFFALGEVPGPLAFAGAVIVVVAVLGRALIGAQARSDPGELHHGNA